MEREPDLSRSPETARMPLTFVSGEKLRTSDPPCAWRVGISTTVGLYDAYLALLTETLNTVTTEQDRGTTFNNLSQIFKARGDDATALTYLEQSLAIQREIGDISGMCATLFNMGHIHAQNEDWPQAIAAWVSVYQLAKPRNIAQALDALKNLAERIGLQDGLDGWERLASQLTASGGT